MGCRVGRGVFTLVLVGVPIVGLPIAHEALSRWVVTLIVRVSALEEVVSVAEELM